MALMKCTGKPSPSSNWRSRLNRVDNCRARNGREVARHHVIGRSEMKLSVFGLLAVVAMGPAAATTFAQSSAATTANSTQDKAISERIASRIADEPSLKADAVKVKV